MDFERFRQSPTEYLIVSLVLTLIVYGAFPVIFAMLRKKPITKKKYRCLCYGINSVVLVLFVIMNGSASSGAPYLLWTCAFSSLGIRILDGENILLESTPAPDAHLHTNKENKFPIAEDKVVFCRKCGSKLEDKANFCSKCGTNVVKE